MSKEKNSSVFGIIAIVIGVLALFTPKLLLTPVLGAAVIFMIIGFARDGSKVASTISLIVVVFMFYILFDEVASEISEYRVTYEVECKECSVRYVNSTGGTTEEENVRGFFSTHETVLGKDFIRVSAQNEKGAEGEITSRIKVNGILLEEETSSGKYAIASVSGLAKQATN